MQADSLGLKSDKGCYNNLMATELNLYIDQGATWTKEISWQDSDGVAYDLSGYTARMQIRKNYADLDKGEPLLSLDDTSGITLAASGTNVIIDITAEQTEAIPLGQYYYDLELVNGSVTKLLRGKVFILGEVTR